MKKKWIHGWLLFALAAWGLAAFAASAADDPLRVGFFAFSGYHEMDEDGRMSGYGYDTLQKIAQGTDWTYEFLDYDASFAETLDMLERGELDIVTSASKTPERQEKFLFSDKPIGTNSTIFTVKAGNTRVKAGDYATYDGLTIGMLENNSKNDNFVRFAEEHQFQYKPVYFGTEQELTEALQNEEVDGIVTGSLRATQNEWLVESFAASNFYVVMQKDDAELMRQMNEAIDRLDITEPNWRGTLNQKYYGMDSGGYTMLDAAQRAYLDEMEGSGTVLKVLVNPDRSPYSYFKDGEAKGILPALFERMAEKLSLPYEYIVTDSREAYYEQRQAGAADVVLDLEDDYYLAEKEGYKITSPYIEANYTRLTRKNFDGMVTSLAAMGFSDSLDDFAQKTYPLAEIRHYGSVDECVKAVRAGDADCVILFTYTAEQIMQQDVKNKLSFSMLGETPFSFTIGVNTGKGHILLSLLNREISALTNDYKAQVIAQETDADRFGRQKGLLAFFYENPLYGVLGILFFSLFVIVCLTLLLRMRNQRRLEKRIAEVSARYEEQKKELSDALVLADQANRAKTTFLNNMSHDIRTPMNAIIGFTALATTHLDNRERALDYLEKIAQSSSHLLSLINDVLDMSRIESGNVNIEEKPENLAEILHGLRNIIQADIHSKRLELFIDTVDVADENICCDKLRLNQVLLNLLSNAIKFTEPGGTVSLRVTQKPSPRAGYAGYEFRVKDTGIGMSEEFAKTIFEPFTRERSSTVSGIQGTGLGMSITKNIVNMMNGSIEVHSEVGKGTEFVVNLEFQLSGGQQKVDVIVELKGLRGLVVDDDIVSCQSVSKMLRQVGMRSEWTMYGKEAVIRTSEAEEVGDPYHVYIIDWSMSDMNGIETVRQIRRVVGDEAPIILLSAYDWSDIEGEAREAGVTDFVSKPLFASELHRTLERTLGKAEDVREMETVPQENIFHGKRILLAEDNELNREIATELLKEAGFLVECAENGQEAFEMVCRALPGYYDLVLMDVQMPVMDGYAATKLIRELEDPARANVPIIAMTANAFEEDRKKALQMGMDGHLAKPVDIKKMMRALAEILDGDRSGSWM